MLKAKQISREFWAKVIAIATYILNKHPIKNVHGNTLEEA